MADLCLVTGNNCIGNTSSGTLAGIHATAGDNRIEGNHVTFNDYGIKADGSNNLITRNSARSNNGGASNYSIAAGNRDAQRLSGGTSFVSTDPWANFAY